MPVRRYVRAMWWALVVVVAGCGRFGFGSDPASDAKPLDDDAVAPPAPVHVYSFDQSLADDLGGPPLMALGGMLRVGGGYAFDANQGLVTASVMPARVYTIDVVFSFATVATWRKIIDVAALDAEPGLYVHDAMLTYVVVPSVDHVESTPRLAPDTTVALTLTRDDANHVAAYLDRVPVWTFVDTNGRAALNAGAPKLQFFIDDSIAGGTEASAGVVKQIRIYDRALTPSEVADRD